MEYRTLHIKLELSAMSQLQTFEYFPKRGHSIEIIKYRLTVLYG
jgi:hypothetical protein